ncbi:hypothetical protein [Streptomyces sp. KR55]|uniref:hypothetical protein n=1 Tax=Streptomyces sp. KR55 TaxID=3457425 RepID=UPI003FCFC0AB
MLEGPGVVALSFRLPVREEPERRSRVPGPTTVGDQLGDEGPEDVQGRAARPGQRHPGPLDRQKRTVDTCERALAPRGAGRPGECGLRCPGHGGEATVVAQQVGRTYPIISAATGFA